MVTRGDCAPPRAAKTPHFLRLDCFNAVQASMCTNALSIQRLIHDMPTQKHTPYCT